MTKTYVGDSAYSIAELARLAHTDTGTMSREVKRLEAAGILRSRDVGRTKIVRASQEVASHDRLKCGSLPLMGGQGKLCPRRGGATTVGTRVASRFGSVP